MSEDPRLRYVSVFYIEVGHVQLSSFPFVMYCQQAELSKDEMTESVPSLKAKIAKHRPRIVCFVGKGIWIIVEAVFRKQARNTGTEITSSRRKDNTSNKNIQGGTDDATGETPIISLSSASGTTSPNRSGTSRRLKITPRRFDWGLQHYKLVYPALDCELLKSLKYFDSVPIMLQKQLQLYL